MATSTKTARPQTGGKRRKPVQKRAVETVEGILDAASLALREFGLDEFSTARVAEQADLAIGSVYQYFPDKHSILLALQERWYEMGRPYENFLDNVDSVDQMAEIYRSEPGAAALGEAVKFIPQLTEHHRIYFDGVTEALSKQIAGNREPNHRDIAAARSIITMGHSVLMDTINRPQDEADEMLKILKAVISSFMSYWRITSAE